MHLEDEIGQSKQRLLPRTGPTGQHVSEHISTLSNPDFASLAVLGAAYHTLGSVTSSSLHALLRPRRSLAKMSRFVAWSIQIAWLAGRYVPHSLTSNIVSQRWHLNPAADRFE